MVKESIGGRDHFLQGLFSREDGLRELVRTLVQEAMEAEVAEHVGADRHERKTDRSGYRNGYKPRKLQTRVGALDLEVPQTRGMEPYRPSLFGRYARSERALLSACAEMYFQGVSTRKVQEVMEQLCAGVEISAMTVSRVAVELDGQLAEFRDRRLEEHAYPYLLIDARYEKVRVDHKIVSQAVLVVVGITNLGRRDVLDWRVADSESEQTWGEVFRSLKDRGLRGVELVVSDAHSGIRAALARYWQGAAWQRCRVHFKRELAKKVSYKMIRELMKDQAAIFAGGDEAECLRRGEEVATKWEGRYPVVARMIREGLPDCLSVLRLPEHQRRRLASTNMLENLMKRLKARTRVVGIFPNRASLDRLIGAQLLEVHEDWQVQERAYVSMEYRS